MIWASDSLGHWKNCTNMQRDNNYTIYTDLLKNGQYNSINKGFWSIFKQTVTECKFDTTILLEQLKKQKKVKLSTFYLHGDYIKVKKLTERKKPFAGVIITEDYHYSADIIIQPNMDYIIELKHLYKVFEKNNIEWRTPCVPYFFKMFDVYITHTNLPWYEKIVDIDVDFEEYKAFIEPNSIPVWNVENIKLCTDVRPLWDEVTKKYYYVISKKRLKNNDVYLIADDDIEIIKDKEDRGIQFVSTVKREADWHLCHIDNGVENIGNSIFHNKIENRNICSVRTIGGIYRSVNNLGYSERFELKGVELLSGCTAQTDIYQVNRYWEELLTYSKKEKTLRLLFKNKINDYLQTDILSYIVSEIQRQYPEYCCIAERI